MDSLTQMALGGAVGYAIMGKKVGKKAALYGAFFGTLPDLDVFIPYGGPIEDFTYHRGATHSLLIHALITPMFAWLITKLHPLSKMHLKHWMWMIFAVLSTHALLDSFTVYGTQLLWPISEYPFGFSTLFIIDPLYTLPLLFGWLASMIFSANRSFSHQAVKYGLLVSSLYLCWSSAAKWHVDNLNDAAFKLNGIKPDVYVSTPSPFNTFLWRSVAVENDQYYEIFTSVFDQPEQVSFSKYKQNTALIESLEDDWGIKRLRWFTKGAFAVKQIEDDVYISDLRMGIEESYVFTFRVAKKLDDIVQPAPVFQRSDRPELDDMSLIWSRIFDPSVALTPDARASS